MLGNKHKCPKCDFEIEISGGDMDDFSDLSMDDDSGLIMNDEDNMKMGLLDELSDSMSGDMDADLQLIMASKKKKKQEY